MDVVEALVVVEVSVIVVEASVVGGASVVFGASVVVAGASVVVVVTGAGGGLGVQDTDASWLPTSMSISKYSPVPQIFSSGRRPAPH